MNTLEIRYFHNIELRIRKSPKLISNGGYNYQHELIDDTLNDFFEFYIDGKPLIQLLFNSIQWKGYLENYNGLLGTRDKIYDELLVNSLLNKQVNTNIVKNHFAKYERVITDQQAKGIIYEMSLMNPLIYGCKICGDIDCGGINIRVEKSSNSFVWFKYSQKSKKYDYQLFEFNKEQYKLVFTNYIKNWKKATIRKVNYH